jgi:glutamyl-tRNA synthetase
LAKSALTEIGLETQTVRTRVAPSPTGDPHVGTAYVALVNLCFSKNRGGEFVLRIEDTDRARSTKESERAILDSLRWLGLNWTGEPARQSERSEIYREHVQALLDAGHAFRCFCTPERLEEMRETQRLSKQPPHYDGHCLHLSEEVIQSNLAAAVPFTIRMKVPETGVCVFDDTLRGRIEIEWKSVDMQVLMKSDGFPTYHLANVVDDHLMGITHVIRGEEWISSAPKHILLYRYFGWTPPQLCHLPLLRNPDRSKLSKRKNPTSILYYRQKGYLAEALLNFLGLLVDSRNDNPDLLQCDSPPALVQAMARDFDLKRIALGGPVFDMAKLNWLNGQWIRRYSPEQFLHVLEDWGFSWPAKIPQGQRLHIAAVAAPRIETLADFGPMIEFFVEAPRIGRRDLALPKLAEDEAKPVLNGAIEQLLALDDAQWTQSAIGEALKAAASENGRKFKDVARLFYIAITGSPTSLPLFDGMEILGKIESVRRLRAALEALH